MYGVFWHATAKPGKMQELLDFLEWDLRVARDSEPGTMSFDVYSDAEDPDGLFVYEGYVDQAAFAAHQANEPFQKFSQGGMRAELIAEIKVISPFAISMASLR
jgi:quinol monooxygenase YgiN